MEYYEQLFAGVKQAYPQLVIHSIGPSEILHMAKVSGVSIEVEGELYSGRARARDILTAAHVVMTSELQTVTITGNPTGGTFTLTNVGVFGAPGVQLRVRGHQGAGLLFEASGHPVEGAG